MRPKYPDFDPGAFMEALTLGQVSGYCLADLFRELDEEIDLQCSSGRWGLDAALKRIYDQAKEEFDLQIAIQRSDRYDI